MHDIVFRAIADPMRREILTSLRGGTRSVGELAAALPLTQPGVSQHLKVLLEAGLVARSAEGTRRLYSLRPEGLMPLRTWVEDFWDDALDRFSRSFQPQADPWSYPPEQETDAWSHPWNARSSFPWLPRTHFAASRAS
jgi:DNA-binding transcriptional ArsR family regulator